jgi:uncharacterized protein YlaI
MTYGKDTGYSYAGRLPCGCIIAAHVDSQDNNTANAVAEMIRDGLTIERMKHEDVHFTMCETCQHWADEREARR